MVSWAGLALSGIEVVLQLYGQSAIFIRLSLSLDVDSSLLLTTGNSDGSSENNLTPLYKPRGFHKVGKKVDQKLIIVVQPPVYFFQLHDCPLRTTIWFLSVEKDSRRQRSEPSTLYIIAYKEILLAMLYGKALANPGKHREVLIMDLHRKW